MVYVINQNGNPLMPCKPAKAKHLLKAGKAKCIKRKPFTIKLLWNCEENTQEVVAGKARTTTLIERRKAHSPTGQAAVVPCA